MAAQRVAMPVAAPVAKARPPPVAQPVAAAAPAAAPVAAAAAPAASPVAIAAAAAAAAPQISPKSSNDEVDARIILDMPLCQVYSLRDGVKHLVESGTLELLQSRLDGAEVYLLLLGSVKLALRLEVPCLEMAPRNFVFPTDGNTYGLVVPDSIEEDVLEVFRGLLQEHTSFRSAAEPQPIAALPDRPDRVVSTANSVAAGLGAGSVVVATGVIRGGKLLGGVILKGGEYLASKLTPNAEATRISQAQKDRLAKAKFLSGAACKVSKALVVGAMATTELMSKQLTEALKDTDVGRKLASDPDKPNPRLDAAKTVGKATIGAVLQVYGAIETAVFGVAADAASATVTVVRQKYGEEAGAHTHASLGVAGDVAVAATDVKKLGIKSIAKKTLIKTSQEVLTTPAERAAAEEAKRREAEAAGPAAAIRQQVGVSMGLPEGVDPLVAIEAAAAVAQLSSAASAAAAAAPAPAAASAGHAHSASHGDVIVTTATATGATPAIAQANATRAAKAAVAQAVAQPVKK